MAEELALQAITQYWKAYLSWISYTQSLESLKTYDRLVRQVNNKQKYSFFKTRRKTPDLSGIRKY